LLFFAAACLAGCGSKEPPAPPRSFTLTGTNGGDGQGLDLANGVVLNDSAAAVPQGDFYLRLDGFFVALGSVDSQGRFCDKGTQHATLGDVSSDPSHCVWQETMLLDDNSTDFAQTAHVGDGFLVKSLDGRAFRGLITGGSLQGGAVSVSFDVQWVAFL
jgi:hypothetical protein